MTVLHAVLLGALQGVAEFLPISSSGHLVVLRELLGIDGIPVLFDVLLHFATLAAIFIVFRKRIGSILVSLWNLVRGRKTEADLPNLRLTAMILLGSVFTAGLGFLISRYEFEGYPKLVSALFLVTAALLLVASRFGGGTARYETMKPRHGIITGIAQGIGVLPGISRSGITISAALLSGMNREQAGEFSFLISIPAILGAFLLSLDEAAELSARVALVPLAVGILTAFVVGLFSLVFLLRLVRRGKLHYFSFYLIPVGILGLIFL
jgi:undecaprenyl-diphosphatase